MKVSKNEGATIEGCNWIASCGEGDGSFVDDRKVGPFHELLRHYESVRRLLIAGVGHIGSKGGRVCASSLGGLT